MPSIIKIKARIADLPRTQALAAAISDTLPTTLQQRDTFFRCANGRLKLREIEACEGELIVYDRANTTAAKQSDYEIAAVADPQLLKQVLQRALGVTQIIEKKRVYYLVDQTRMHLDSVVGLGNFLELEVVLRPNQSPAEGHAIAADLLRRLEIRDTDLMATAYADMLE
ncbi:MAG: class IV adenylate cyclase [Planctomycetota bacterium]